MPKSNIKKRKELKKKGYISLLLLLLTISLFVTATFAWFTDSAFSKGNKVFAGNLYVDVIATEQEVVDRYNLEYNANLTIGNTYEAHETIKNRIVDAYGYEPYIKKYRNPYFENETNTPGVEEFLYDYYYIITDEEAATMNLYNVEPGQFKVASIHYLNSGDLAFRAAGAIKIDTEVLPQGDGQPDRVVNKSYTGLENLNRQFKDGEDFYKNNYAVMDDDETGNQYIDPLLIYNSNNGIKAKHQSTEIPEEEHVEPTHDSLQSKTPKNNKFYSITKAKYDSFEDASNAFIDYEYRFNKLLAMQASKVDGIGDVEKLKAIDADPYVGTDGSFKGYINNGGHLEDVLEVYIIPTSNLSGSFTPANSIPGRTDIVTPGRTDVINTDKTMNIRDMLLDKSNGYFFGTVKQFNHLMTFGYIANQNLEGVYEDSLDTDGNYVLLKDGSEVDRTIATPEEEYKYLYEDAKKDLYTDYQKYLENVGGYCLPKDVLKDEDDCYPYNIDNSMIHTPTSLPFDDQSKKVKVKVYEDDGSDDFYFANELGDTRIAIYMPEDVNSKYQNASISLKYGVTASQLEFEMDDTGYMLYDKDLKDKTNNTGLKPGQVVSISVPSIILDDDDIEHAGDEKELLLRVLKCEGNEATFLMLNELKNSSYYFEFEQQKFEGTLNAAPPKYAGEFSNLNGDPIYGINYYNSKLDTDLERMYASVTNDTSCLDNTNHVTKAREDYSKLMGGIEELEKTGKEIIMDSLNSMFGSIIAKPVNQKNYALASNTDVSKIIKAPKNTEVKSFQEIIKAAFADVDSANECDHAIYLSQEMIDEASEMGLDDIDENTMLGFVNDGYLNTYSESKNRHFRSLTVDDLFDMFEYSNITRPTFEDVVKTIYGSNTSTNAHDIVLADAFRFSLNEDDQNYLIYKNLASAMSLCVDSNSGMILFEKGVNDPSSTNVVKALQRRIVFTADLSKFDDYKHIDDGDSFSEIKMTYEDEDNEQEKEEDKPREVKALLLACDNSPAKDGVGYYKNSSSEFNVLKDMLIDLDAYFDASTQRGSTDALDEDVTLDIESYKQRVSDINKYYFTVEDGNYNTNIVYSTQYNNFKSLLTSKFSDYDVIIVKIPDNDTPNLINDLCSTDQSIAIKVPNDKKLIFIGNCLIGANQNLGNGSITISKGGLDGIKEKGIYFIGNRPSDYFESFYDNSNIERKTINDFFATIASRSGINVEKQIIIAPALYFDSSEEGIKAFAEPMYPILFNYFPSGNYQFERNLFNMSHRNTSNLNTLVYNYYGFGGTPKIDVAPVMYLTCNEYFLEQSYNLYFSEHKLEQLTKMSLPKYPSFAFCNFNLLDKTRIANIKSILTKVKTQNESDGSGGYCNFFGATIDYLDILGKTIDFINTFANTSNTPTEPFIQANLSIFESIKSEPLNK